MDPYDELVAAWRALPRRGGFSRREVACVGAPRTLEFGEIGGPHLPTVAISAGVHGDEPASSWALLSLVRDGLLDPAFRYRLWPCTNPSGYRLGTRESADGIDVNRSFGRGGTSPEARAIVTANRDRKFALTIDLHEDYESDGFYCYEPLVDGEAPLGECVIRAVEDAGFPIQEIGHDFNFGHPTAPVDPGTVRRGRVLVDVADSTARFGAELPYSLYVIRNAARRTFTCESPRRLAWERRIAIHRVAVVTVLASLRALPTL